MSIPFSRPQLTAHHLKLIAAISMLIDHIGAIIVYRLILAPDMPEYMKTTDLLQGIYAIMRAAGRLAFPLYCFLLVEGFRHTRNKPKYAIRLLLFAVLSEIPYDLAFSASLFDPTKNNVFLTLSLGFLMMWAIDIYKEKSSAQDLLINIVTKGFVCTLTCCVSMLMAFKLNIDYSYAGIFTIWILFMLPNHPIPATLLSTLALSVTIANPIQLASLLSVIPIACYSGQKGTPGNRYLFYAFYPVHLLVLTKAIAFLTRNA